MISKILHLIDDITPFWLKVMSVSVGLYSLTYLDNSSKKDGRLWPWFQRLNIWKKFRNYVQGSISVEEPLDSKQLYIFCAFPHGTCSVGHMLTMTDACGMLSEVYTGPRRDLAASVLFWMPFTKDILMWLGNVDASAATAKYNLRKGRSLLIFIGGEKEQLLTKHHDNKIFLLSRKGFVKLALQYGAHLVPMYTYGENEAYHTYSYLQDFRVWLQHKFQLGLPIIWGRYTALDPLPVKLAVEIGKPVPVTKLPEGTEPKPEEIDTLHAEFVKSMERLFDRTKQKHGYSANEKLNIL